jgi:uncharacterized membrane protein
MKRLMLFQWFFLIAHVAAMVFGLAGLILVLPHPEFIATLPSFGQTLFQLSMTGGGVVYIVLGALTVFLHGYLSLGLRAVTLFFVPAVLLSLGSELLGTSTGFPFGHYAYLSGLGYKIAGLVPFTIPLSWFYLGFSAYLLAYSGLRVGLNRLNLKDFNLRLLAVVVGSVLLTAWDLVLDPAMSQAPFPFWAFQEVGEFFGMPYRNLVGWVGTGMVFMGVAAFLGRQEPLKLTRNQLTIPLSIYLANFAFGAVITLTQLDSRFMIPAALGILLGVLPAIIFGWIAPPQRFSTETSEDGSQLLSPPVSAPEPALSVSQKQ